MSLRKYQQKRNFTKTAEPKGTSKKTKDKNLYIIQQHAASHLHFDLRLQIGNVLKSWAVPKGPSLDANVKRLAVNVEDHPLEYGSFQGTIPEGEYGAGTVMLWDKGSWVCQKEDPEKAYRSGHIIFILKGKKLQGLWGLVRLKTDPKNWLFFKMKDEYAQPESKFNVLKKFPLSVTTHQTMEEIRKKSKRTWSSSQESNDCPKSPSHKPAPKNTGIKGIMPTNIKPQLATLVTEPPSGNDWLYEIKWDGYRLICFIQNKKIKLITRGQKDWSAFFPSIIQAVRSLGINNAILDGEVVAYTKDNPNDFQLLQNAIHLKNDSHLIFYIFDLLYYAGKDLRTTPLIERKRILKKILDVNQSSLLQYNDHLIGSGLAILKKTCALGLEGIIAKKTTGHYIQKRTKDWQKIKCGQRQEFVICGYTAPKGQRQFFGSLILGYYQKHILRYCGHVGTGFTEQSLKMIYETLQKIISITVPFKTKPKSEKNITWVKPKYVAEVEFIGWTQEGILRQPSFKGLREDKSPKNIIREIPEKQKGISHGKFKE